jgi:hypothetical protein
MTQYPVPPGWKLVPEQPTEEMVTHVEKWFADCFGMMPRHGVVRSMLSAAIAAAPQPPAPVVIVTNTPRAGETPEQTAARDRTGRPCSVKTALEAKDAGADG